jgi:hypothetical protein
MNECETIAVTFSIMRGGINEWEECVCIRPNRFIVGEARERGECIKLRTKALVFQVADETPHRLQWISGSAPLVFSISKISTQTFWCKDGNNFKLKSNK